MRLARALSSWLKGGISFTLQVAMSDYSWKPHDSGLSRVVWGSDCPIPVLSMGAVFALFASFTHYFPLFLGVTLHERWLVAHFFMMLVGVNVTFFPQHFLGLAGLPRRISDYPMAYTKWNIVSSVGGMMSFFSVLFFIFIVWEGLVSQRPVLSVGHQPSSLEWKHTLPLATHNLREMPKMYHPR